MHKINATCLDSRMLLLGNMMYVDVAAIGI